MLCLPVLLWIVLEDGAHKAGSGVKLTHQYAVSELESALVSQIVTVV